MPTRGWDSKSDGQVYFVDRNTENCHILTMKTLLMVMVLVVGGLARTAIAYDAVLEQALAELATRNTPAGADARAVLANPIIPGESRPAWEDRLERAKAMEAKVWTAADEQAYSTRYAARIQAEAQAREAALLRDAINRNTDALILQRRLERR